VEVTVAVAVVVVVVAADVAEVINQKKTAPLKNETVFLALLKR
jgi:hypothetical protein